MANAALIVAGSRIVASEIQSVAPLAVIKGADEDVTSSVALQNDNELFVEVDANATYLFDCYLDYEGASGSPFGIQWQWTTPSGATLRYQGTYNNTGGSPILASHKGSDNLSAGAGGAGTLEGISMNGSLIMSSTAGTLQLQWAQASSSSTPTIVHAQSYLALWRVT
jgi:hypothetical protein